ncbi:MAG: thioredoxin [Thermoflexia bacterium]|nr:MAG: thioredoxin [Thermoflexia bacterium]
MDEPIHVTDAAFERVVLQADRPVVAAFWSRNEEYAPRLEELLRMVARRYGKEARVVGVERRDALQAHSRYSVDTLPQFLFFRDGRLVARARGMPSLEALRPWMDYLLGRGPAPVRPTERPTTSPPSAHPVVVTDADFDEVVLRAKVPVLVDFWAAWCGPCRTIAPVVERLAAEFAGRALVVKLDVDRNPQTALRYNVMSIPTLIFFQDGREVDRLVGVQPESALRARLEALTRAGR